MLVRIGRKSLSRVRMLFFPGSAKYWEKRYASGGNSGRGSYGEVAAFKADTLNDFVSRNNIQSVIEFGSGDGNQLSLANYPKYIGLDVSKTAIMKCKERFAGDTTKSFFFTTPIALLINMECFRRN